jgi:hypothetical protein
MGNRIVKGRGLKIGGMVDRSIGACESMVALQYGVRAKGCIGSACSMAIGMYILIDNGNTDVIT